MNNFSITGNLGRDCNVNQVGSGTVCNFVVAVKSGFGDKQQTLWIDCALWGKQAESRLPEFLVKGQGVAVSGELGTREYDKDGQTKTALTLRVSSVDLVGAKSESAPAPSQPAQRPAPQQQAPAADNFDDIDW
jgi:single-strand DNA-binding protein